MAAKPYPLSSQFYVSFILDALAPLCYLWGMLSNLFYISAILIVSALAYYYTPDSWRDKWYLTPLKLLRGVWMVFLEIVCVRVENGGTKYKPSTRKWLSYLGPLGFTAAVSIKLLYPIWAQTRAELLIWQAVANSVDTALILGLLAESTRAAYAYFKGKQQELGQHQAPDEDQK